MKMKRTQSSLNWMIKLAICALLFTGVNVFAEPTTYRNGGLKNETIVTLEVQGKTATGTFVTYEYGDELPPATPFTGKVVLTPKGKHGIFLEISFAGAAPYSTPPDAKSLLWSLKTVNGQTRLFIPMYQRSYDTTPPKWTVVDVEFEPDED
jgi:hypothetical protein